MLPDGLVQILAGRVTVFGAATAAPCVDREARRFVETLPSAGRLQTSRSAH